jgi:flagellar export protein FliJ
MPFRFRLATLLRVRLSLEQAEERKLHALLQRAAALRLQAEQAEDEQRLRQRAVRQELCAGLRGAEIQFMAECDGQFEKLLRRLEEEQCRVNQQVSLQRDRLLAARRERETLEVLEKRQLAAYQELQARREQQQRDETSSLRWFRRISG